MTKGIVILKKGKEFISLGYLNSDGFIEGSIGEMLLKAFSTQTEKETETVIREFIKEDCDSEYSRQLWECLLKEGEAFYDKEKSLEEDAYWYDYLYVYDTRAKTLKVYSFGKLDYTLKKKDIGYLRMLVEEDDLLFNAYSYDSNRKDNGKDWKKVIRKMIREGISPEEIVRRAREIVSNVHFTVSEDIVDAWGKNAIQKRVMFYPTKRELSFIIQKNSYTSLWSAYIQLPWVRTLIVGSYVREGGYSDSSICRTKESVIKKLIKFLDENWDSLQQGIPLYDVYWQVERGINAVYSRCEKGKITAEEFKKAASVALKEFDKKAASLGDIDFSGYKGCFDKDIARKKLSKEIENAYFRLNI